MIITIFNKIFTSDKLTFVYKKKTANAKVFKLQMRKPFECQEHDTS